jgi:hypothetical protein
MRILVTVPQDSPDMLDIALYCQQHHLDLRKESWHLDQRDFEFHILYATELDRMWINWMYLQWPNRFFEF